MQQYWNYKTQYISSDTKTLENEGEILRGERGIGLGDSENAISDDLATLNSQKFSARRQPWWRLVEFAPPPDY